MSAYIAHLRREIAAEAEAARIKAEAEATKLRQQERCTKPLTEQIEELLRTLAPPLRDRPWSMAELVTRLQGKYRDRPHTQHVGTALRRLGWRRERRWGQGYDGVRVWVPPTL